MKALPVHEMFHTFQGEGCHMGKAAFFIRLYGCPLHCPWCDSAGTWHKDYVPKDVQRIPIPTLVGEALASGAPMVVVTGGEPCIHDLKDLTGELLRVGLRAHLETSGAFPITGTWRWVTVSPKDSTVSGKDVLSTSLSVADELKIIVDDPNVPLFWLRKLTVTGSQTVWLHPEWSRREDPVILSAIAEAVKAHPMVFRAGWQLHKLYRVDLADNRSRPAVPLGGDPSLGF